MSTTLVVPPIPPSCKQFWTLSSLSERQKRINGDRPRLENIPKTWSVPFLPLTTSSLMTCSGSNGFPAFARSQRSSRFPSRIQSPNHPESSGIVSGWNREELERRAIAGAGGQYTHYANSLITLSKMSEGLYQIIDLEMFYRSFGWCIVFRDGQYAPAGNFWDDEPTQN